MENKTRCDVIIAGVGGQGILLCSNVLGTACIDQGIPVKGAEVHGMAQRGGSVEAHIRIDCLYGPRIPVNKADILIAMEPLEGARFSFYLKPGGIAVVNTAKIPLLGQDYNMGRMLDTIKSRNPDMTARDFTSDAIKIGNLRTLNVLMLGVALKHIPLDKACIIRALHKTVRKEFLDINLDALSCGMSI